MTGRRREQRFILNAPWEGALRLPTDVVVERCTANEVLVVSPTPARRNEMLTLDTTESGSSMNVRVADSVPVVIDGVVRHRLRLAIVR
jgi:hypothetical protein